MVYPVARNITDITLEGWVDDLVSSWDGAKLVASMYINMGKYSVIDFLIQNSNIYLKGRLLVIDQTLYIIETIYDKKGYSEEHYDHFLNSFKLMF